MFKTAVFDCAIHEKCCSVDGGRDICPLFSSPHPAGFDSSRVPTPGNCHPRQKKMLMLGGQPGGGGGLTVELNFLFLSPSPPSLRKTESWGKALDNIDLNQMSHRYVSGVLQNDWNDPVDFRLLDRSQRRCYIWVSLSYKTVNTVVSSLYH